MTGMLSLSQVRICDDPAALGREAAEALVRAAADATGARGRFSLVLPGGSTPRPLFELLGREPYRSRVPWTRTHLFWSDERLVPPDHDESNYGLAVRTFLPALPVPAEQVHRIRAELGGELAAETYEKELWQAFGGSIPVFDLVILGVGADGHTASLFPGSPAVEEGSRLAFFVAEERRGLRRVTLTLPVLNSSRRVIFLASGSRKANIVASLFDPCDHRPLPLKMVRPEKGEVVWMIDREAAAGLSDT
ncbi:MAG: 6-phosphogluconolactonase [Nitrospiraceae bacterium]|nr:6-phosphogluconolactonase [Nitrospiraceae bacterium]